MNKEDLSDFNWDEFLLSMESSADYPHLPNPCSMSMTTTVSDVIIPRTNYNPSTSSSFDPSNKQPPPLPRSRKQPPSYLEKGDSSTHNVSIPRVATPLDLSFKEHRQQQPPPSSREMHSVSQKRRRDKVKEKIDILKELVPNCDKKDMASVLDEAIKYIQLLKFQAQWYSGYQHQLHVQQSGWMRATWNPQMINPRAVGVFPPAASSSVWARGLGPYNLHYNINNYPPLHQPSQQLIIISNPPLSEQYVTAATTTTTTTTYPSTVHEQF